MNLQPSSAWTRTGRIKRVFLIFSDPCPSPAHETAADGRETIENFSDLLWAFFFRCDTFARGA